jgi:hypothetical protein
MCIGSSPNFQKHFLPNWVILILYFGLGQIFESIFQVLNNSDLNMTFGFMHDKIDRKNSPYKIQFKNETIFDMNIRKKIQNLESFMIKKLGIPFGLDKLNIKFEKL